MRRQILVPLLGPVPWNLFRAGTLAAPLLYIVAVWVYVSRVPWPHSVGARAELVTAVSIVASLTFAYMLLTAVERAYLRLEEAARTARRQNLQLKALHTAGLALTRDLDLRTVLSRVVELSREVLGAQYAALRVLDEAGEPGEFVTSGMDPELVRRLGDPPQGRGVLGVVAEADRPVRLSRIADHPRSVGFPPGHPEMKTFIGAPLRFGDRTLGFLYLTEKRDGAEFTRDDEDTVERFAAQAGAAIANARLMREVRRLGSVAERERIGRELHDGTLQELYALSLHLQAALLDETGDPSVARQAISRALKRINQVMADIRRYVFGAGAETSLRVNLLDHIKEAVAALEDSGQAEVAWTWHLPANLTVPEPTAHDLAQVVREAVSNAVRHGKARHIVIAARRQGGRLHLAVRDDGQGFRQTRSTRRAGHGLANMARRAEALGGRVTVRSSPGAGTRIGLSVPEPWGHEG